VILVDGLSTLYQLQRKLKGSGHALFVGKFQHFVEGKEQLHLSMCRTDVSKIVFIQGNTRLHYSFKPSVPMYYKPQYLTMPWQLPTHLNNCTGCSVDFVQSSVDFVQGVL